tara:strand:- start:1333 stop:1977 length:645 start_codon:yes stop_codon:yes gene_type:complete
MFFIKLLTDDNIKYCTNAIKKLKYEDGSFTQPLNKVYTVKQNQEILAVPEKVRKYLIDIFYNHSYIDSVYCPNRISVNFYNKYQKDDFYDLHVDSFRATPKSNNVYFDYGFSVNLNDKYEGGEFFLQTEIGPMSFKLAAGEAAVFPIIYPHGVNKVTSGVRENILGWFSSNVSYEQSFILKNLYDVQAHLKGKDKEKFVQTTLVQSYLKKVWGK